MRRLGLAVVLPLIVAAVFVTARPASDRRLQAAVDTAGAALSPSLSYLSPGSSAGATRTASGPGPATTGIESSRPGIEPLAMADSATRRVRSTHASPAFAARAPPGIRR